MTGSVSAIAALHWIALEVASLVAAGSAIFQPRESFTAMMLLLLIIVYGNFFQKRSAFFHPLLIDLLYGFCMGFPVVLVGSLLSVDGSTSILLGIGVGSIFALLNISSGNLKDLRYDLIDGAKTTAIVLGVRPKANAGVVERPFPALYVVVLYALAAVPLGVVVMLTFLRERTYEFVPIRLGLWGLAVALCLVALIDLRWRISRNPVPEDGQDEILGRSTFEVRDGSQGDPVFVSPAYAFALLGAMVVGTGSVAPKPGLGILLLGLMVAITAGLIGRESIQRRFS